MTPASSAAAALQGHRPVESEATRRQRRHLAMAYRVLHRAGIDDLTYNLLSARLPDRPDRFLVKRADELFEQVTASSLLVSDFAGADPDPAGRVSPGGLVIHGGVLGARPDVAAVFHTHSPAAMAVNGTARPSPDSRRTSRVPVPWSIEPATMNSAPLNIEWANR